MLSGELLNGHLFDSNGLIQKVVDLGPISELQKMRDKHLYNVTPWRDKRGLRLFFSDEEGDSDDDSRLAVTTAWGIRLGRRGSMGISTVASSSNASNVSSGSSRPMPLPPPPPDSRDRIALDISLLKKQYDKLRERQRQAHIILTTTARQTVDNTSNASSMQVNQYLMGRNAIVSQKGRRIGPPPGAIPPVRKVANLKSTKNSPKLQKRGSSSETLQWKDIDSQTAGTAATLPVVVNKRVKDNSSRTSELSLGTEPGTNEDRNYNIAKSPSVTSSTSSASDVSAGQTSTRSRKKSESSSYSDESDGGGNSSTSTSLCDEDNQEFSVSSIEVSPLRKKPLSTAVIEPSSYSVSKTIQTNESDKSTQLNDCIEETLNKINSLAAENITTTPGKPNDDLPISGLQFVDSVQKEIASDVVVVDTKVENSDLKKIMTWNTTRTLSDDVQITDNAEMELTEHMEPTTQIPDSPTTNVGTDKTEDNFKSLKYDYSVPEEIDIDAADLCKSEETTNEIKNTETDNSPPNEQMSSIINNTNAKEELSLYPYYNIQTDDRKYKEIDDYLQIISIDSSSSANRNNQILIYEFEKSLNKINDATNGDRKTSETELNPITLEDIAKIIKETEEEYPPIDLQSLSECVTFKSDDDDDGTKENIQIEKLDRINYSLEDLISRTGIKKDTAASESEFAKVATSSSTSILEALSTENDESMIECDSVSEQDSSADISISKYIFVKDYPESVDSSSVTSANPLIDCCIESVDSFEKLESANYQYSISPAISLSPIDDPDDLINDEANRPIIVSNTAPAPTTLKATLSPIVITSTSQLSPIADISKYLSNSNISPLKTPSSFLEYSATTNLRAAEPTSTVSTSITTAETAITSTTTANTIDFKVNYEGVTNEYFERITAPERPSRLELRTSVTDSICNSAIISSKYFYGSGDHQYATEPSVSKTNQIQRLSSPIKSETTSRQAEKSQTNKTYSLASSNFMKEKSISLDEPTIIKKNEFRPTSCPETVSEVSGADGQHKSADRVLKIIEENSLILHRILKKTMCNDEMGTFVEEGHQHHQPPVVTPPSQLTLLTDDFADCIASDKTLIIDADSECELKDTSEIIVLSSPIILETKSVACKSEEEEDIADISVTLTSIQNTIKSVESLCQYDENKTAELLAACERLAESEANYTKSQETLKSPIIIEPPTNSISISFQSQDNVKSEGDTTAEQPSVVPPTLPDEKPKYLLATNLSRYSRDSRRASSPRRKVSDDDREEYESRVRRDESTCTMSKSDIQPNMRVCNVAELDSVGRSLSRARKTISGDYSASIYDSIYKRSCENIEKSLNISNNSILHKSYESNLNSSGLPGVSIVETGGEKKSSLYGNGKFEIRHTTVTSTLYDRYLSQQKERNKRLDKSPSSPTITKTYVDSLRLPRVVLSADRNSKSAENSPSRPLETKATDTKPTLVLAPSSVHTNDMVVTTIGTNVTSTTVQK